MTLKISYFLFRFPFLFLFHLGVRLSLQKHRNQQGKLPYSNNNNNSGILKTDRYVLPSLVVSPLHRNYNSKMMNILMEFEIHEVDAF
jgi:hypothetical protein